MKSIASRTSGGRWDRRAFTLLELTAASVLAALLLVALAGTLRCVARQKRLFDEVTARRPHTQLLADQLRRDVINARYVQYGPAGMRLVGPIAQDRTTRVPTGRLAEVTYRVSAGDGTWLSRSESHLDQASGGTAREEPVWSGASRLEVVPLEQSATVGPVAPGLAPVPPHLLVMVYGPLGQPIVRMFIRHHWEER
jgi:hypothetical protein